jgi:DNA-binding IscR family transcriptional regulator
MLGTNPVVVRRMMAGLRSQGYVKATRGPGGGWRLARRLDEISILDVYEALGSPLLFSLGIAVDHPDCLVEQSVNARLGMFFDEAETRMLARYKATTLADIVGSMPTSRPPLQAGASID